MDKHAERRLIVHSLIRAAILGGIAFYIVKLQTGDRLTLYIAPRMAIYVKLAAIGLYAVAAFQLYRALSVWNGRKEDCGCEHAPSGSLLRNLAVYALFVVPLGLFFLSPDTTIGSAMAAKKGMTLSASAAIKRSADRAAADVPALDARAPGGTAPSGQALEPPGDAAAEASGVPEPDDPTAGESAEEPAPSAAGDGPSGQDGSDGPDGAAAGAGDADAALKELFPADEYTEDYAAYGMKLYKQSSIAVEDKNFMELLTTLDLYLDNFVGKQLTIEGFVYRDDSLTGDRFILGRFAVQCCTADALPYGVLVDSQDASRYKNDSWLRMTGTIRKGSYNGADVILLEADKTETIKPAADPYVYPDPDFGT